MGVGGVLGHNACRAPDTRTWNHIFRGDISPGGTISGYHHRMFGWDKGSIKLINITKRGKKGVYGGIIEYIQNGSHKKYSTFFPNSWSPKVVKEEVNTALFNALNSGQTSGYVRAKGKRGVLIEMIISDGIVKTAYPIIK